MWKLPSTSGNAELLLGLGLATALLSVSAWLLVTALQLPETKLCLAGQVPELSGKFTEVLGKR